MAWTTVDSLQPSKAANRLVNTTGIRLRNGACYVFRIVARCLKVDSTAKTAIFNLSDANADGGTDHYRLTFQRVGDVFELRWRNGWRCANGLGADITAGVGGDAVVMIDTLIASPLPA